jgi:hypothetical protein
MGLAWTETHFLSLSIHHEIPLQDRRGVATSDIIMTDIEAKTSALLVVDMQNDFCPPVCLQH